MNCFYVRKSCLIKKNQKELKIKKKNKVATILMKLKKKQIETSN